MKPVQQVVGCSVAGLPGLEKLSVRRYAGDEPAALLNPNGLRKANLFTHPFQSPDRVFRRIVVPWIDDGLEPQEDAGHCEGPDLLAHCQLGVNEVHSPGLVRLQRQATAVTGPRRHPSPE